MCRPDWRSRRTTPKPSSPGIITSSTSRSGRKESASASACWPSAAVATSKPAYRRLADSSSRMLGSSSTTSSRASGAAGLRTAGHGSSGRACGCRRHDPSVAGPAAVLLDATCELPGGPTPGLSRRATWPGRAASSRSRGAGRGPAPPAPQVGADRPDGGGLRADPREDVVAVGAVERGDGVGQQRALARAAVPPRCSQRTLIPAGAASGCSSAGPATSSSARPDRRGRRLAEDPADRGQRGLVPGQQQEPAGRSPSEAAAGDAEQRARAPRPPPRRRPGRRRGGRSRSPPRRRPGPAGGRCSCAARRRGCPGARRSGRPWRPAASRGAGSPTRGHEQVHGGAGGGDGGRGAGQDHPAHGRRHVGDGRDGQHVDRASPSGAVRARGVLTSAEPRVPVRNGADPADSGGMESTGPAIEDGC